MDIDIRIATAIDLPDLLELDAECFPSGHADLQPAAPGEIESGIQDKTIFVAMSRNKVVGMLQFEKISFDNWELLSLAITSAQRGRGIGKALLDTLFAELSRSPSLVTVSCLTSPNNGVMQGLLGSFGFVQVAVLPNHFGPGKHRLKLQLN